MGSISLVNLIIRADPRAKYEHQRIRNQKQFLFITPLAPQNFITCIHLNIRSFNKYVIDISKGKETLDVGVLYLTETHIKQYQTTQIAENHLSQFQVLHIKYEDKLLSLILGHKETEYTFLSLTSRSI